MTDTYAAAKEQLDDIVAQVRKKDVSLERSLDLLEEGVLLANRCTELIDQAAWDDMSADSEDAEADAKANHADEPAVDTDDAGNPAEETMDANTEEVAYPDEPAGTDTDTE